MRTHTPVTHSQDNPRADTPKPTRKRSPRATTSSAPNTSTQQPPKPQKPLLLDLFCGAGGAGMGYSRAGFNVVGVDLVAQPHYPFVFRQGDALECLDALLSGREWGGYVLEDFAAIHASPPCQDYSSSGRFGKPKRGYPRLIEPIRLRLIASNVPWILENVRGAIGSMAYPMMICGTALGLRIQRHRLFDCSILLFAPGSCRHHVGDVSVRTSRCEYLSVAASGPPISTKKGEIRYRNLTCPINVARSAMGIDWPMTRRELGESIPPAYTEWIGRQLMAVIAQGRAA